MSTPDEIELVKGRSLMQDAFSRMLKNRMAMMGGIITLLIAASALFADYIVPFDPTDQETHYGAHPPGTTHLSTPSRILLAEGDESLVFPPARQRITGVRNFEFTIRDFSSRYVKIQVSGKSGKVKTIDFGTESDVGRVAVSGPDAIFRTGGENPAVFKDLEVVKGKLLPAVLVPHLGKPVGRRKRRVVAFERRELEKKPHQLTFSLDDKQLISQLKLDGKKISDYDLQGRLVLDLTRDGKPLEHSHLLGQDQLGRDILSRVIIGGRISFLIGVIATFVSLIIGVLYGSISGYAGGRTDEIMMRIVDILYGLPYMFLVIILMVVFGRDIKVMFLALGAVQWLTMSRIVRGQMLSLKQKEYIEAAQAAGGSAWWIITRHLIPNTMGVIAVYTTLTIPSVILQESFLSFIGLSVEWEGKALESWGALTNNGINALGAGGQNWWMLVFPAFALGITLFSFNFLGDGLRDAFDPQMKGRT